MENERGICIYTLGGIEREFRRMREAKLCVLH